MRQGPLTVLVLSFMATGTGTAGAELPERYRFVLSEGWEDRLEAPGLAPMLEQDDFEGAQALAVRLLESVERERGPESLAAARLLDLLVEIRWDLRRQHEPATRDLALRALRIKESLLAPDDPRLARGLKTCGNLLIQNEEFAAAKPFLERPLAIMEGRLGHDDPAIERYVNSIGLLYLGLGEFERARAAFQRAIELKRQVLPADHPEVADVAYNLAIALQDLGEFVRAGELYREVLAVKRRHLGADHPTIPFFINGLASLLWELGEYGEARALFQEAIESTIRTAGALDLQVATLKNNFGVLLRDFGDFDDARTHLEAALRIRELLLSADHPLAAQTLYNLGRLFQLTGNAARARDFLQRARDISRRVNGPGHPVVGTILHDLAWLEMDAGHAADAQRDFEQALEIWKTSGLSGHPDMGTCLNGLGLLLWKTGAPGPARARLEAALQNLLASLGDRHPLVAKARLGLGLLLAQTGDRRGALEQALLAEEISRESLEVQARLLPEHSALTYASVRVSGLDLALSIADADPGVASAEVLWDAVIRSRGVVLDTLASRNRMMAGREDPETRALFRDLRDVTSGLSRLHYAPDALPPGKDVAAALADLRERKQRLESRIAAGSLEFRRTLTIRNAGFREVATAIGPEEALVSFVVFRRIPLDAKAGWWSGQDRSRYLAFVFRRGADRPRLVPIADADALDSLVRDWSHRQTARVSMKSVAAKANADDDAVFDWALRKAVWDPLQGAIAGADKVLITPDGALHSVNFYALRAKNGTFLIESGPLIHYLSTERALLGGTAPAPRGGLLAMGDVDYPAAGVASRTGVREPGTEICPGIQNTGFPPLPHTRAEVDFIVYAWRQYARPAPASWLLLTQQDATEAAFKAHAPGRKILHLAAHGFFLDSICPEGTRPRWRGIGGLSPVPGNAGVPRDPWSPLLVSGVVLAGTNPGGRADAVEDGFLTAEEISFMDLGGTEWVVLSACDTARGAFQRGEGILGLRRAFHIAGAKTLIMSLWPVDDEAASQWMMALYRGRLEKGLTTAEAVRAAGREVLAGRRTRGLPDHPFFWAGWVAEGDWR